MGKTIKVRDDIYEKVKASKKETGVPVATFFEKAAEEKLKAEREKK